MEYIIETKDPKTWQKLLNQWKHTYHLEIFLTHMDVAEHLTLGIKRTRKKNFNDN